MSSVVGVNVIVKKWGINKDFCLTCEVTTIDTVCDFGSSVHKNSRGKKLVYENQHFR